MIKMRLVRLLSHAKKQIVLQIVWQWLSLLSQVLMIFSLAILADAALEGDLTEQKLWIYAGLGGIGILLRFFFNRQASYASYRASVDVKRILREKIYGKLLCLGASYKEQTSTSQIVQMAAEGVEQLETYFGRYLPQLFYSLLAPVTLFVLLSFVSVKASLVLLVCVPLIPMSIVAVQKLAKKLLNKYWGIYTELGDSFLENLQGMTTLKIYQADEEKAKKMDEESQRFRKITMKVLTMQLNSTSVMDVIAYGGAAVGIIMALAEFAGGHVELAGVLMIVLLASEFFIPLRLLGSFFHIAMNGMAASDNIFALLDLPEPEEKSAVLKGDALSVTMSDVHFSYEQNREILKGITAEFPSGSLIGLVGVSGCGKSTIARILTGRNSGYLGDIQIQGQPLSQISEKSLAENITLVSHGSYLFKGTVAENLWMGNPKASEKEMKEALREVNLWEFLKGQGGLETVLLERGSNLSGGQRQRLAMARALLHDSPIYILDEATSNIDVESEKMIMNVVHRLAEKKTVIVISHRLANVVRADQIYLLGNGRILQQGTHEELMEQGGDYRELYLYQRELEEYGRDIGKSEYEESFAEMAGREEYA